MSIALLSRQAFYDTFAEFNTEEDMELFMRDSFGIEKLAGEVGAPGNTFLSAFMENELVGYAKLTLSETPSLLGEAPSIEISRIYAAQKTIGLGVGKALMEACVRIAKEQDRKVIWLGVWEHNERAIGFYKKFGFEKFGEHDFVLGKDVQTDWLMKKML